MRVSGSSRPTKTSTGDIGIDAYTHKDTRTHVQRHADASRIRQRRLFAPLLIRIVVPLATLRGLGHFDTLVVHVPRIARLHDLGFEALIHDLLELL